MTSREPAEVVTHRRQLLHRLTGRVIELGSGAGANFPHYPSSVTEVVAVEPEPYMREQAIAAAARAPVSVTVLEGTSEQLPIPDGSCDAAVACLVLCSVPDPAGALTELRRVLRSGGQLRFYEHVRSHKAAIAASQRLVDIAFWPRVFGGCHTARDTPAAIQAAGFEIEELQRLRVRSVPVAVPVGPHALGRARKT